MSEPSISPGLWSLSDQVSEILRWFENPESNLWASTCCRRHGLPADMAGDIHSDSWVKVRTALARRTESFQVYTMCPRLIAMPLVPCSERRLISREQFAELKVESK